MDIHPKVDGTDITPELIAQEYREARTQADPECVFHLRINAISALGGIPLEPDMLYKLCEKLWYSGYLEGVEETENLYNSL